MDVSLGTLYNRRLLDVYNVVVGLGNKFALWLLKPMNRGSSGIAGVGFDVEAGSTLLAN